MVNSRAGVGKSVVVGAVSEIPIVGCCVADTGGVGRATMEEAGFWLQATNPTNRITVNKLLMCNRSNTGFETRIK
jgi:hypothetical protein